MGEGHDHDVAGGIGIGVEADVAMLAAMNQAASHLSLVRTHPVRDGEVDGSDEVAEDAAEISGPRGESSGHARTRLGFRRCDVGIAPGGPEMIH